MTCEEHIIDFWIHNSILVRILINCISVVHCLTRSVMLIKLRPTVQLMCMYVHTGSVGVMLGSKFKTVCAFV